LKAALSAKGPNTIFDSIENLGSKNGIFYFFEIFTR